jgi:hypothetical protein
MENLKLQAYERGWQAFKEGKSPVPTKDKKFMKHCNHSTEECNHSTEECNCLTEEQKQLFEAWILGWYNAEALSKINDV